LVSSAPAVPVTETTYPVGVSTTSEVGTRNVILRVEPMIVVTDVAGTVADGPLRPSAG
jgi:hypothetical protein